MRRDRMPGDIALPIVNIDTAQYSPLPINNGLLVDPEGFFTTRSKMT